MGLPPVVDAHAHIFTRKMPFVPGADNMVRLRLSLVDLASGNFYDSIEIDLPIIPALAALAWGAPRRR